MFTTAFRLPSPRNVCCRFYDHCLTAHAGRDDVDFDCLGCDHWGEREPINPREALRAADLIEEIYGAPIADLFERPVLLEKRGGCWRQVAAISPEEGA